MAHWTRGILLAFSLIAVLTTMIWIFAPILIDKVDFLIVSEYQSYYQARFEKAKTVLNDDKQKGIAALESFLNDIESIEVSDRLDKLKYQAFPILIKNLKDLELFDDALYWVDKWLEFHEKDIFAQVWYVELLLGMSGREKEGAEALSSLFENFPGVPVVANAYARMVGNSRDSRDPTKRTTGQRLRKISQSNINLYWRGAGGHFSENHKSTVLIGGKIVNDYVDFNVLLPLGQVVSDFRIDFPEIVGAEYTLNEIKILSELEEVLIEIKAIDIAYKHNMEVSGNKFYITGEDPHFVINLTNFNSYASSINLKGCAK